MVLGLFFIFPVFSSLLSIHFRDKILTTNQATEDWRWSKLLARVSCLSPFFWDWAKETDKIADLALNERYLSEVIGGEDGSATADDHLDFLANRSPKSEWESAYLKTMFHYGQNESILLGISNIRPNTTAVFLAASLQLNQIEELVLPPELNHELPEGIRHYLGIEQLDTENGLLLSALTDSIDPESLLEMMAEAPVNHQALLIEHYIDNQGNIEGVMPRLESLPLESKGYPCAVLAVAKKVQASDDDTQSAYPVAALVDRAIEAVKLHPQYPTRFTISSMAMCTPERFEPWESLREDQKQSLGLYQARSWLGQYQIAKAQESIKYFESFQLPSEQSEPNTKPAPTEPDDHDLSAEQSNENQTLALHLRVIARELAGDLEGAKKYALRGLSHDKAIFTLHLGRIALLQNQKTEGLKLLSSIGYYPMPEPLLTEFSELLAIARRLNGSQAKLNIQGKEIGHTLFDNDELFREWLVEHIDTITLPPQPSMALPMLNAWRGVDRHGTFLLSTQMSNKISPQSIVIRAHLRFLQSSIEGDSEGISKNWTAFVNAREWLASLPHPELLQIMPEAFILEIQ